MYNINRVGENVTSIEEYDVASINTATYAVSGLTLVGTMHYSFDSDGKQFRKKYVASDGTEQKYVFEYQDEQNVAVQLPTGVVSHAKSDHLGRKIFDELQLGKGLMNRKFTYHEGVITDLTKQIISGGPILKPRLSSKLSLPTAERFSMSTMPKNVLPR